MHEVLRLIDQRVRSGSRPGHRTDGCRLVLSVEGGGMRGTLSAGMALALHELGLVPALDAVYGASAGAITGAWLLSSAPAKLRGWADPDYARTLIRWSALLRGRPVVDVRMLVEVLYRTKYPMDFASILASEVEYHPLATDAETGQSTDLRPLIADPAELRLALRASASLPFLAGPPVWLRDRRFYDAGVAESIPFRTPLAQGATHVLVLRSRQPSAAAGNGTASQALTGTALTGTALTGTASAGTAFPASLPAGGLPGAGLPAAGLPVAGLPAAGLPVAGLPVAGLSVAGPPAPWSVRLLTMTMLRNESLALRMALLTRGARTAADAADIAGREAAGQALAVFPPPSCPPVSRLTTDSARLAAAFEAGRATAHAIFRVVGR